SGFESGSRHWQAQLQALLHGGASARSPEPASRPRRSKPRVSRIAVSSYGKVLGPTFEALRHLRDQGPVGPTKIAQYLNQNSPDLGITLQQVRDTMKQLRRRGDVQRVSHGLYLWRGPERAGSSESDESATDGRAEDPDSIEPGPIPLAAD